MAFFLERFPCNQKRKKKKKKGAILEPYWDNSVDKRQGKSHALNKNSYSSTSSSKVLLLILE